MSNNRTAPFRHPDGSNCWTKDCRLGHQGAAEKEAFINEVLTEQRNSQPANISDIASREALDQAVADVLVTRSRHGVHPYSIYKYAKTTPYKKAWNAVTTAARGLIVHDETGEIIARPFPKFFNLAENMTDEDKMTGPVEVMEKLDGCFTRSAKIMLWSGEHRSIKSIVDNPDEEVFVVGMDGCGNLVPAKVTNRFNNGTKKNWLQLELSNPVSLKSGGAGHPNKMIVTSNHHLYLNGDYKAAGEAVPGDIATTRYQGVNEDAIRYARAGLLGDGCISGNRYQENHVEAVAGYVEDINQALGTAAINSRNTVSGYGSNMHWITTITSDDFVNLRNEWYDDETGRKTVPQDLSWIDDFAVAKWIMDDGYRQQFKTQADRLALSTNSFTFDEITRLGDRLAELYGVTYHTFDDVKRGTGITLIINSGRKQELEVLWAAVAPYIHPDFQYKLPEKFRSNVWVNPIQGAFVLKIKDATVLNVEELDWKMVSERYGATGYDIETETHNYIVNGIIVHNSLGILYQNPDGSMAVATAGSMNTPQAEHATALYNERYHGNWKPRPGYTYLYEIIHPDNRIVVDYGDTDDLVLLGAVNKKTGRSLPLTQLNEWPGPRAEVYTEFSQLSDVAVAPGRENKEGYIVHFTKTDTRVKVKHDEYVRLHRTATGLNPRRVWENLFFSTTPEELARARAAVDVDFLDYYDEQQSIIVGQRDALLSQADQYLADAKARTGGTTDKKTMYQALHGENMKSIPKDVRALIAGTAMSKWYAEQTGQEWTPGVVANQRLWNAVKPEASKAKFLYQSDEANARHQGTKS